MVYEPDFDFSQALLNTNKLRVYPEMIRHIPFDTFYLDFSKNGLFEYEGFFVQVKVYDTGALRIVSLPTEKNYSNIPLDEYEQEPTAYQIKNLTFFYSHNSLLIIHNKYFSSFLFLIFSLIICIII